jgi:hypothetical protein
MSIRLPIFRQAQSGRTNHTSLVIDALVTQLGGPAGGDDLVTYVQLTYGIQFHGSCAVRNPAPWLLIRATSQGCDAFSDHILIFSRPRKLRSSAKHEKRVWSFAIFENGLPEPVDLMRSRVCIQMHTRHSRTCIHALLHPQKHVAAKAQLTSAKRANTHLKR